MDVSFTEHSHIIGKGGKNTQSVMKGNCLISLFVRNCAPYQLHRRNRLSHSLSRQQPQSAVAEKQSDHHRRLVENMAVACLWLERLNLKYEVLRMVFSVHSLFAHTGVKFQAINLESLHSSFSNQSKIFIFNIPSVGVSRVDCFLHLKVPCVRWTKRECGFVTWPL